MTQVFLYGGVEIMHPKKGSFKVNTQRLKPYFGGNFHASKHQYEHIENSVVRNSSSPVVSGTLRFKEVELMTLNKALLGRQPKHFKLFHSLV